jgi:hypothetical protein
VLAGVGGAVTVGALGAAGTTTCRKCQRTAHFNHQLARGRYSGSDDVNIGQIQWDGNRGELRHAFLLQWLGGSGGIIPLIRRSGKGYSI